MKASGPQILVAFERRVAEDKAAKLIGTARVRIDHLAFPDPIRGKVETKIKELKGKFALKGCLDEQHRIPAVIDDKTLQTALLKTGLNIETLQGVSDQPQSLHFPENMKIECLHGQHRILAAKRYLKPKERWWTVDLYRTDLDDDTRHSLLGGYGYSSDYTDGEIFRQVHRCQASADKLGEIQWRARLTKTKNRDLDQLLRQEIILNALDSLLPIQGLWKEFNLGSLHLLLNMRIDEEIAHYISVEAIRCLLPGKIKKSRRQTNKAQRLTTKTLRHAKETLRLTTKTLRQNLYSHFEKFGSTLQIQNSERAYLTYTGNNQSLFNLAFRQLHLFAIRHFAKPLSEQETAYSMFILADFAQSVGFSSEEITSKLMEDPFQKMALDLLHRALPIHKPADLEIEARSLATQIRDSITTLGSSAVEDSKPWLTVAGCGVSIAKRCGPEVWDDNVESDDLKHMFLEKMHLPLAELQRGGEGISSFYVKRSIYLAFWGGIDQSDQSNASLNTAEETRNAHVYESIPSGTARADNEELAEQMDDITQTQDIPNDSAPKATILKSHIASYRQQQVVTFSEKGVTVHETPFLKDEVNAQALRIVDSGKLLSTVQGEYFLWRDCFETLARTGTAVVLVKPSRAELQRRRAQAEQNRELYCRREQSARDRRNHQTQLQAQELFSRRRLQAALLNNCDATVNNPTPLTDTDSSAWPADSDTMVEAPSVREKSRRAFDSLFNNEKYSDVILLIGESKTIFLAHRLVLGIRSLYFDDALQSKFKEAVTNEFIFDKDSPHALWRVLQYIYTGDYADDSSQSLGSEGDDVELLRHPRVYALADMFRMEDLKTLVCKKFEAQLQQYWISDTFVECIREVYMTSRVSEATRKAVVRTVFLHKELVNKQPFQDLIREVGDFAVDLVSVMAVSKTGY
ncbi:hypothetical protein V490_00177 [Pseudogymnoascus sp. VKM F-3557]|nr:hypothetical protein V490_00177 [Pseudogymnoascus sp. VKM F-3557]